MQNIQLHPDLTWQHYDSIDSTNAFLLANDQASNQLISADHQYAGRGRRQQKWVDERNSLLMSLSTSFHPNQDLSSWAVQTAITLTNALTPITQQTLKIKWPNDLYTLNQQSQWGKFSGILIESSIGKTGKMVTGIGINLSGLQSDIDAEYPISHLQSHLDKMQLIPYLGNALFDAWQLFIQSPKICPDEYRHHDFLQGKMLTATDLSSEISHFGRGAGINEKGQLLLNQQGSTLALTSQQRIRIME